MNHIYLIFQVLSDPRAYEFVDGIGMHWYADDIIEDPTPLETCHEEFPDKFLLYTESCAGNGKVN